MLMDADLADIRLLQFPLPLWQQSQEHIAELLREFALVSQGEGDHAAVPRRLLDLVAELTATYAGLTTRTEQERDDALARGEDEVDLVYRMPPAAAGAVRHLGDLLDEADDY